MIASIERPSYPPFGCHPGFLGKRLQNGLYSFNVNEFWRLQLKANSPENPIKYHRNCRVHQQERFASRYHLMMRQLEMHLGEALEMVVGQAQRFIPDQCLFCKNVKVQAKHRDQREAPQSAGILHP